MKHVTFQSCDNYFVLTIWHPSLSLPYGFEDMLRTGSNGTILVKYSKTPLKVAHHVTPPILCDKIYVTPITS